MIELNLKDFFGEVREGDVSLLSWKFTIYNYQLVFHISSYVYR